jgi:transposase
MRRLTISDAETISLAVQDEIRRSEEARYDHRLHGILLVAQGMSCAEVGRVLGDAPRTVAYWVRRFEESGFVGLHEGARPGRPARLDDEQLRQIEVALRGPPSGVGVEVSLWDGKAVSEFIRRRWGIDLGVRQCQRLFRRFGFRLRKPRPVIARADPERQEQFKKTHRAGQPERG